MAERRQITLPFTSGLVYTVAYGYRRAKELTTETGIKHEVDHIIPLRGRNVSGLHIPINLQILTITENRQKFTSHGAATQTGNTPVHTASLAARANGRQVASYSRGSASPRRKINGVDVDGSKAGID